MRVTEAVSPATTSFLRTYSPPRSAGSMGRSPSDDISDPALTNAQLWMTEPWLSRLRVISSPASDRPLRCSEGEIGHDNVDRDGLAGATAA